MKTSRTTCTSRTRREEQIFLEIKNLLIDIKNLLTKKNIGRPKKKIDKMPTPKKSVGRPLRDDGIKWQIKQLIESEWREDGRAGARELGERYGIDMQKIYKIVKSTPGLTEYKRQFGEPKSWGDFTHWLHEEMKDYKITYSEH